jgi:hypothetical protein
MHIDAVDSKKRAIEQVAELAKKLKAQDTRLRHKMKGDPEVDALLSRMEAPPAVKTAVAECGPEMKDEAKPDLSTLTPEAIKQLIASMKK